MFLQERLSWKKDVDILFLDEKTYCVWGREECKREVLLIPIFHLFHLLVAILVSAVAWLRSGTSLGVIILMPEYPGTKARPYLAYQPP